MSLLLGHQIGKDLCDALGLPKRTIGFTLRCYAGEIVSVECEYYPEDASIVRAMARYALVARDTMMESTQPKRVDFDVWMHDRTEQAHSEFMTRMKRLPPCVRRAYTTDEIAAFYGVRSHGGID